MIAKEDPMSYIENFIYHSCQWHYQESKNKSIKPRFMLELINEEVERGLIRSALEYTGFHMDNTAEILGVCPSTLKKKIKKYDIYILDFSK